MNLHRSTEAVGSNGKLKKVMKKMYVLMLLMTFFREFLAKRKDWVATLFRDSWDKRAEKRKIQISHHGAVKSNSLSGESRRAM